MEQNQKQERRAKPREGPELGLSRRQSPRQMRLGSWGERLDEGGKRRSGASRVAEQSPSGALEGPNVLVRIPPRAGLFVKISAQKEGGFFSWDFLGEGCV